MCSVLCFVLSPKQSGVLKCHLSQYQKMKIRSYVFRRVSLLRPEKKKFQSSVWQKKKIQSSVCWVRGSDDYDRKKKDTVVCLAGCAVVLFFVMAGNFDYDRKKKKIQSSVGGKLAVFLL